MEEFDWTPIITDPTIVHKEEPAGEKPSSPLKSHPPRFPIRAAALPGRRRAEAPRFKSRPAGPGDQCGGAGTVARLKAAGLGILTTRDRTVLCVYLTLLCSAAASRIEVSQPEELGIQLFATKQLHHGHHGNMSPARCWFDT
eukprot:756974-Hanusia_phi.AAC.4